jgi:hypothetical protein
MVDHGGIRRAQAKAFEMPAREGNRSRLLRLDPDLSDVGPGERGRHDAPGLGLLGAGELLPLEDSQRCGILCLPEVKPEEVRHAALPVGKSGGTSGVTARITSAVANT